MLGKALQVELSDPPAGVTLEAVEPFAGGLALTLKADDKHVGYADNLIVTASAELDVNRQPGKPSRMQRVSLGVLPAIPFEVVK